MRIPLLFALAASSALCVGCAKPKVWTPFSTPDGKVSVVFPAAPKAQTSNEGGLVANIYAAEFRTEAYLLGVTELPPGAAGDIQAALNGIAAKFNGKILSQSPITVNGHTGIAYEVQVTTPFTGFATGRLFRVNNRLYQLLALGNNGRATNPDVVKFLGSLDLSRAK